MVELALNGDPSALRLCIERLIPRATNNDISLELPELNITAKAASSIETITEILNSVLDGEITPDDAKKLIDMIEEHQRRIKSQKSSLRLKLGSYWLKEPT